MSLPLTLTHRIFGSKSHRMCSYKLHNRINTNKYQLSGIISVSWRLNTLFSSFSSNFKIRNPRASALNGYFPHMPDDSEQQKCKKLLRPTKF